MARVAFTYADWTQNVDLKVGSNGNPTPRSGTGAGTGDNLVDGDQFALLIGGSGKGALYYTGQKWQVYANALYQLPWGIDISGTAWGWQGGLKPVFHIPHRRRHGRTLRNRFRSSARRLPGFLRALGPIV